VKENPRAHALAPFDSVSGAEHGKRGKGKPKSIRRLARLCAFKPTGPNGEGPSIAQQVLAALVMKAREGDVRAINAYVDLVDPPRTKHVEHRHSLARSLLIRPDDDPRGLRAAPAELVEPAASGEPERASEEPKVR